MLPLTTAAGTGFVPATDDLPLFVRWRRPPTPRARVLLLHGYSEHSGRYLHVLDALEARGYATLAPDHRGHGRTAVVPGDLESIPAILGDLAVHHRLLVDAVPGVPTVLVAHSMGGLLGLAYLARYSEAFAGAVINGPGMKVPSSVPRPVRLAARILARIAPTAALQPFFDPVRNMRDPVEQERLRTDPLVYKGRIRARTGAEAMRAIPRTWASLDRVRCPVLITHGARDLHVPVQVARDVLERLGAVDKELVVFDDLLHETHNEPERDVVVGTWLDWLDARVASAAGVPS